MDIIRKPVIELSRVLNREVEAITLLCESGASITVWTYGGIIAKMMMPDRKGLLENVVLAYPKQKAYAENVVFLNTLVGPTAGRMADAQLVLESERYSLEKNHGRHHIHGGGMGFHKQLWTVEDITSNSDEATLVLTYHHQHLIDGFPGNMVVKFILTLTEAHAVHMIFEATSDRLSHLNMTHHNYFNLSGKRLIDLGSQKLFVNATRFHEIDADGLPLADVQSVLGTPFDFRTLSSIEKCYASSIGGIDHPFLLERSADLEQSDLIYADPMSGRMMQMRTNHPAVVIYTNNGDFLHHKGICFETQSVPNTVVQVTPEKPYQRETVLQFSNDFIDNEG